jgi:hypothetical protein
MVLKANASSNQKKTGERDQANKVTSVAPPLVLSLRIHLRIDPFMNKTVITGIVAVLALMVMSYLMFQNFGRPATMQRVKQIYVTLDSNGDGRLDSAEIEAASERLLQLDDNGDGVLSEDEIFTPTDD